MKSIAFLYILLIVFSIAIEIKRKRFKSSLKKITKSAESNFSNGSVALGAVGACMKAFMQAIPPAFCWKPDGALKLPQDCPAGYFRSAALCYQYCKNNYRHVLGVCWQDCPSGYYDHGATCFQHLFSWFFKHSYIPHSVTNFSDMIKCPDGYKKDGALCTIDCKKINPLTEYTDCGLACAESSATCAAEIIKMVVDTVVGVASFVSFVLSVGASGAATAGVKNALKQAGKKSVDVALKFGKSAIKKASKKFVEKAKKIFIDYAKDQLVGMITTKLAETFCDKFFEDQIKTLEKQDEKKETSEDEFLNFVDVIDLQGSIKKCSNAVEKGTPAENMECAKSVLNTVSAFDPTGLVGIAATFMHPICEKFEPDPSKAEPPKVVAVEKEEAALKNNEMRLYPGCFYGDSKNMFTILDDQKENIKNYNPPNDCSSVKIGKDIVGYGETKRINGDNYSIKFIPLIGGENFQCLDHPLDYITILKRDMNCIMVGLELICEKNANKTNSDGSIIVNNPDIPKEEAAHRPLVVVFIHPNIQATFIGSDNASFTVTKNEDLSQEGIKKRHNVVMTKIKGVLIKKIENK